MTHAHPCTYHLFTLAPRHPNSTLPQFGRSHYHPATAAPPPPQRAAPALLRALQAEFPQAKYVLHTAICRLDFQDFVRAKQVLDGCRRDTRFLGDMPTGMIIQLCDGVVFARKINL